MGKWPLAAYRHALHGVIGMPHVFKISQPSCCCEEGCDFVNESFGSSDTTTIAGFSQVSGNWSISTGHATISASSALLVADTVSPDGRLMHVTASVRGNTVGDQARVISSIRDTSNYLFAQVTFGTTGSIALVSRTNSTNTTLMTRTQDIPINTWHTVTVCNDNPQHSAGVLSYEEGQVFNAGVYGAAGDDQCGLGTGTCAGIIDFDDLVAKEIDETCERCRISCSTNCLMGTSPQQYQVVLTGVSSGSSTTCPNCSTFNATFIFDNAVTTGAAPGCRWSSAIPNSCYGGYLWTLNATSNGYLLQAVSGLITEIGLRTTVLTTTKACDEASGVLLDEHFGINTICNSTVATATITALTT